MKKTELKKTIEEAVRSALKEYDPKYHEMLDQSAKKIKKRFEELLKKKDDIFVRHDETGEYYHVDSESIDPDDDIFFWGSDNDGGMEKLPYVAVDIID